MGTSAPDPKRVLVIKLGALGDVVQALGPMAAIRKHHKTDQITVLTTAPFEALIASAGVADEIWLDRKPGPFDLCGWLALRHRLRDVEFSRVYDLQTSDRSSGYFRLFWPGPKPEWSGIAAGCSHPHANPARDAMHTLERQAEQLQMAGIDIVPAPDLSPIVSDISHLRLSGDFCLIMPGGAGHRQGKRWPQTHYKALIKRLESQAITPVICGSAAERPLAANLVEGSITARNIAGETSLIDLVTLAKRARFAVGNDNGPMHIAAFAGVPSIVLYSHASDPALCAQRGRDVTILRRPSLADISVDEVSAVIADKGGS